MNLAIESFRPATSVTLEEKFTVDGFMAGQIFHSTEFFSLTFPRGPPGRVSIASVSPSLSSRVAGHPVPIMIPLQNSIRLLLAPFVEGGFLVALFKDIRRGILRRFLSPEGISFPENPHLFALF